MCLRLDLELFLFVRPDERDFAFVKYDPFLVHYYDFLVHFFSRFAECLFRRANIILQCANIILQCADIVLQCADIILQRFNRLLVRSLELRKQLALETTIYYNETYRSSDDRQNRAHICFHQIVIIAIPDDRVQLLHHDYKAQLANMSIHHQETE